MVHVPEPILQAALLSELRPTQMTVGMREVAAKRKRWRDKDADKEGEFLGRHSVPVLRGPKNRLYLIDHHHLCRALMEEGVEEVQVTVVADLSSLDKDGFWTVCDHRGWCHPYDRKGRRCGFDAIPASVGTLEDDPYRSLAGELRRVGGFAKDTTPFSEFLWAHYLRGKIKSGRLSENFNGALKAALKWSKSPEAAYLPGWCGPSEDS